jgi:hypothetical protein
LPDEPDKVVDDVPVKEIKLSGTEIDLTKTRVGTRTNCNTRPHMPCFDEGVFPTG